MKHQVREMIESSPGLLVATPVYTDNFTLGITGVLNIYYDLTEEDCSLVLGAKSLNLIQFARGRLNDTTLKYINEILLPSRPNICLRVTINGYGAFDNLEFLSKLPNLRNLRAALFNNNEVEVINKYLRLETLAIGTDRISLRPIVQQTSLKNLFISDKPKDVEVIGEMPNVEILTFSMQTLRSLDFLIPLINLKELHFKLGGTKNLSALPLIGKIEILSFTWVRQLMIEHLLPINEMKCLRELSFDKQSHLTNLDWLKNKTVKTKVINCKNFTR